MAVFYTSDTHFGHAKVADLRGFNNAQDHDEEIIRRWNAVVKPGDMVWHLGDVGLSSDTWSLHCVSRLNGTKHLITGNHDSCWPGHRRSRTNQAKWFRAFKSVQAFARTRVGSHEVLLSHFPYIGGGDHTDEERGTQFRLPDEGGWLIHGHLHCREKATADKSIHVGLDAWNLVPVSEAGVLSMMKLMKDE